MTRAVGKIFPCWGIGLGRTGTTSLCEALKILGYRRVVQNPRFEQLRNLGGGADLGVVVFYKYLDFKFPGSRFVLTLRPLEDWLGSTRYIFGKCPATAREDIAVMRRMAIFETVTYDRRRMIAAFRRHNNDVRRYFRNRPQDLLELNIVAGEGWEKLCPFLGTPLPAQPFPHTNARGTESEMPKRAAATPGR